MNKERILMLAVIWFWLLLLGMFIDGEHKDTINTIDERLDTIQETVDTIQNTLQDSTLILKKKYHDGNVYIDLWQGEELK